MTNTEHQTASPRSGVLVFVAVFMILFWSTVAFLLWQSSLKDSVIQLPGIEKPGLLRLMPEGWGFFTRNAQEEDLTIYTLDQNENYSIAFSSENVAVKHAFGLYRETRKENLELGLLSIAVASGHWQTCKSEDSLRQCLKRYMAISLQVQNVSPRPQFCGSLMITAQKPVPWAWRNQHPNVQMDLRFVKFEALC